MELRGNEVFIKDRLRLAKIILVMLSAVLLAHVTPAATCTVDTRTGRATVQSAEDCINPMIRYINSRMDAMNSRYYYQGGVATMQAAFLKRGLNGPGHADSWGKWMGLVWSQGVKKFYLNHSEALESSLATIRTQGYATKSDLDYLTSGMRRWTEFERGFPEYFEYRVARSADEETIYEEKDAYSKRVDEQYDRLNAMRPYPSGEISALKEQMSQVDSKFEAGIAQIDREMGDEEQRIGERAQTQIFTAIKEGLVTDQIA